MKKYNNNKKQFELYHTGLYIKYPQKGKNGSKYQNSCYRLALKPEDISKMHSSHMVHDPGWRYITSPGKE